MGQACIGKPMFGASNLCVRINTFGIGAIAILEVQQCTFIIKRISTSRLTSDLYIHLQFVFKKYEIRDLYVTIEFEPCKPGWAARKERSSLPQAVGWAPETCCVVVVFSCTWGCELFSANQFKTSQYCNSCIE